MVLGQVLMAQRVFLDVVKAAAAAAHVRLEAPEAREATAVRQVAAEEEAEVPVPLVVAL